MVLTLGRGSEPSEGHKNAVSDWEGRGGRGFDFPGEAAAAGLGPGSGAGLGVSWSEGLWAPQTASIYLSAVSHPAVPEGSRSLLAPSGDYLFDQTQAVCSSSRPQLEDIIGAWRRGIFRLCVANLFLLLKGADLSLPLSPPRSCHVRYHGGLCE